MNEATKSSPVVSVVIVNYNGGSEIIACLRSLFISEQRVRFEVAVVDNGSTDGSLELIMAQYPLVKVYALGENRGFAAACNVGIANTQASAILLLNPDTEIRGQAISLLWEALEQHEAWGIVGARMLDRRGIPYRAARRFPQVKDLVFDCLGLSKLFPGSRLFNGYLYGERPLEQITAVDQVEGSCLMISSAAWKSVGPLDERFFIFFEEVDWCKRVKEAGFEISIVTKAEVLHHISSTMSKHYERIRKIHAQSAMKYFAKHHGQAGLKRLRTAMRAALYVRMLLLTVPAFFAGERNRRRWQGTVAEWRAYGERLPS